MATRKNHFRPTPPLALLEMSGLPEELVVEILLRLPVKSILRFKSVCKSWYALFKSPRFVSMHLAIQSKKFVFFNRYCPGKERNVSCILSAAADIDDDNGVDGAVSLSAGDVSPSAVAAVHVDLPSNIRESGIVVVGHCDGILAISDYLEDVFLCNLATRDFRTLPKSKFHPFPQNYWGRSYPDPLHAETSAVGFGYDHKTKDYKVVRVVAYWVDKVQCEKLPSRAEVFSIGTDSSWREIINADVNIEARSQGTEHMEHYLNGICYWLAINDRTHEDVLLSFNMADELFQKAPLPDFCKRWMIDDNNVNNDITLGVYNNESIALFAYPFKGCFEKCIDVWVMKEFGVKESWTKRLTIGPFPGLERPLAFWKNEEELLYEDQNGQLMSCDIITLESQSFPFHGYPLYSAAITYMKTLVSINTREHIVA